MKRLGHEPKKTLGQIGSDLQAIGRCINYAAAEAYQHVPLAYQIDDFNDWIEDIGDFYTNGTFTPRERRSTIRAKRNKEAIKNGTTAVLHASCNIINNMINKSLEDNIADITEFGVDSLITARVTEGLLQVTKFTGNVLIEAGKEIIES